MKTKLHTKLVEVFGENYPKKLAPKLGLTAAQVMMNIANPTKMEGYTIAMLQSLLGMYRMDFEKEYLN